ncbi:MAG: putative DNA-binding domain-containing protein [Pseudomonadota bacterium]
MPDLAAFQRDLARAIGDPDYNPAGLAGAGLSVYRNTVARGLIDVLRANFPTVERLAGEDWFAACARLYSRRHPPRSPVLALYGRDFPDFLRAFEPAGDIPLVAEVARLDRLWTESHFAADGPVLDPEALSARAGDRLLGLVLPLHPAARFAWFDGPAASLWRLNRPPAPPPGPEGLALDWRPEGLALHRAGGAVAAIALSAWQYAFLSACDGGRPFGQALDLAAAHGADADPAALGALFAAGLFGPPDLSPKRRRPPR